MPICARADKPVWAGGGNGGGNANNGNNWTTGTLPGNSDHVKVGNGNPHIVAPLEFGALDFDGGLIDGSSSLTLSLATATSTWTGGEFAGATLNYGTNLTISAGLAKKLSGGQLNYSANTTWSGDNITVGGGGSINNTGNFTTSFDGKIAHDTGTTRGTFTNNGTFTKTNATTGTTEVETIFNNNGTINVNSGKLKLSGGGTSANAVALSNGASLQIASNYTFSGGNLTSTGTGAIEITSATATFSGTTGNATLSVTGGNATFNGAHAGGKLNLANGTVGGTGNATFSSLEWSGGQVTGHVMSTGNATISGSGSSLSGELTLNGTTTFSGTLTVSNAGRIKNESGATFSATGNITGSNATFTNNGTFVSASNGTSSTTEVQAAFANAGTINASSGTLKLKGGGNSNGSIALGTGASIQISGADFSIAGGNISGASGKLELSGNTTTFSSNTSSEAEIAVTGGNAKFDGTHNGNGKLSLASGSVSGSGNATFGSLDWSGGSLGGKIKSTGNANLGGTGMNLAGELTLHGNTNWDGSPINGGASGKVKNEAGGSFTATGNGTFTNAGGATFTNNGSFTKTSGTTEIQARFDHNNGASLNVNAGTLKLTGGGTTTGNVTFANGGSLQTGGSDYAFTGATLSGDGTIDVTGAVTSFSGTSGSANLKVSGGTARLNSAHSTTGTVTLTAGKIDGGNSATAGGLVWTGGEISGATLNSSGSTIGNGNAKKLSNGAQLNLSGTTNWTGDNIGTAGGSSITNAGTLIASSDSTLSHDDPSGTRGTFHNNGTFTKSNGAGGSNRTSIQTILDNTGTINANAGILSFTGGGSNLGTMNVADGATIEVASGFSLAGGKVTGKGVLAVGAQLDWVGGDMTGSGITSILGSGQLALSGSANKRLFEGSAGSGGHSIDNSGTVSLDGSGLLQLGDGAAIYNRAGGNFDLRSDTGLGHSGSGNNGTFSNSGAFTKSSGNGVSTIAGVHFSNNSVVWAKTGTLAFDDAVTNDSGGTFQASNGAKVQFSGNANRNFGSNSRFVGGGTHVIANGSSAFNGDFTAQNLRFEGGTLTGTASLHGTMAWTAGDWIGASTFTVSSDGSLTLDGAADKRLYHGSSGSGGRTLANLGSVVWQGTGNLRLGDGAQITIGTGATFEIRNDAAITHAGFGNAGAVVNNGTLVKNSSNGTTTIAQPFTLTGNGKIVVNSGTLAFTSTFTNNNGAIFLAAGTTLSSTSTLDLGSFGGTGTLRAPTVVNHGTFSPGNSPGAVNVVGNLSLIAGSTLLIELGGRTQGTGYDYINVSGVGTLGGNLSLSFVNGFQSSVTASDTFTFMTTTSLLGSFANAPSGQRVFTTDGFGSFEINYGVGSAANSIVLSNFAVPEPSTWALLGLGSVCVLLTLKRRRAK